MKKTVKMCVAISALSITMTACSNRQEDTVAVGTQETALPVEAYTGDVRYSYYVDENGETVTVIVPDVPYEDKFAETIAEMTVSDATFEQTTSVTLDVTSEVGAGKAYSDNSAKAGSESLRESAVYKYYPLKAVVIPDDIDIAILSFPSGYKPTWITKDGEILYEYEPDNSLYSGEKPTTIESVDLKSATVGELKEKGGWHYSEDKCDEAIHEDENFSFLGKGLTDVRVEVLDDKRFPLKMFDDTPTGDTIISYRHPDSPYNQPEAAMDCYKVKALMTKPTDSEIDFTFGGKINCHMLKEEVEEILGIGYEVTGAGEKEVTAYYQNSTAALAVNYKWSNYYGRMYMDYICVIIKDEWDKCESVPQPEPKPAQMPVAETSQTLINALPEYVQEEVVYDCSSYKIVCQRNVKTSEETYIVYMYDKNMNAVDKYCYDTTMQFYNENGCNVVIIE